MFLKASSLFANVSYAPWLASLIGEASGSLVWIMAREPKMKEDRYNKILENLADIGYDITLIQKVPQDWDN